MQVLQVMQELKALIPPLSDEEYAGLEASLLADGCRDAIVAWQTGDIEGAVIVDGHNRYELCTKHGISFDVHTMNFGSLDDAKIWMIRNQFARRNLPSFVRIELALLLEGVISAKAKANQVASGELYGKGQDAKVCQNSDKPIPPIDTKKELATLAGTSHDTIARAKKIIQKADQETIQELRQGNVSINAVYEDLRKQEKPHVANNSGENEWYTPPDILEKARAVMSVIDLDPASSALANENVKANAYYTIDDDGLSQAWRGSVWMNPPYAQPLVNNFCKKLIDEYIAGNVSCAMVLVNNATETAWFQSVMRQSSVICFLSRRVRFLSPSGTNGQPLQGQAILLLCTDEIIIQKFYHAMSELGVVLYAR